MLDGPSTSSNTVIALTNSFKVIIIDDVHLDVYRYSYANFDNAEQMSWITRKNRNHILEVFDAREILVCGSDFLLRGVENTLQEGMLRCNALRSTYMMSFWKTDVVKLRYSDSQKVCTAITDILKEAMRAARFSWWNDAFYESFRDSCIDDNSPLSIMRGYSFNVKDTQLADGSVNYCVSIGIHHKVVQSSNLFEDLCRIFLQLGEESLDSFEKKSLPGRCVVARIHDRYKLFKIDKIDRSRTMCSLVTDEDVDEPIDYKTFFKNKFGWTGTKANEPILVVRTRGGRTFSIAPSQCRLTGIDGILLNHQSASIANDIDTKTHFDALQRIHLAKSLVELLKSEKASFAVLNRWGLDISTEPERDFGFSLNPETIRVLRSAEEEQSFIKGDRTAGDAPTIDDDTGCLSLVSKSTLMLGIPTDEKKTVQNLLLESGDTGVVYSTKVSKWIFAIPSTASMKSTIKAWLAEFIQWCLKSHGIVVSEPKVIRYNQSPSNGFTAAEVNLLQPKFIVDQVIQSISEGKKPKIVVLLLSPFPAHALTYSLFKKRMSALHHDGQVISIPSQCLQYESVKGMMHATMTALIMKILAKLGGASHRVGLNLQQCLTIGVEVRHSGHKFTAAAAASYDEFNSEFVARFAREEEWNDEASSTILEARLKQFMENHEKHDEIEEFERIEYFNKRFRNRNLRASVGLREIVLSKLLEIVSQTRKEKLKTNWVPNTILVFHREIGLEGEAKFLYTQFFFEELMLELIKHLGGDENLMRLNTTRVVLIYVQGGISRVHAAIKSEATSISNLNELTAIYNGNASQSRNLVGAQMVNQEFFLTGPHTSTKYSIAAYSPALKKNITSASRNSNHVNMTMLSNAPQLLAKIPTNWSYEEEETKQNEIFSYSDVDDDDEDDENENQLSYNADKVKSPNNADGDDIQLGALVDVIRQTTLGYVTSSGAHKYPTALRHVIEIVNKAAKMDLDSDYINFITNNSNVYV